VKPQGLDSDRELVTRMVSGDDRALGELYDRFGTLCYSLAFQILGDEADAEEVVTDAFVQAWSSAGTFDPGRASVAGWLTMIARTRALDRLRARKRRARVVEHAASAAPGGAEERTAVPMSSMGGPADVQAEQMDLRARVGQSLASLPENQRRVIELAFYGGLSHSEIAAALNEPLGTIKTRVRSAMSKLRSALASYQFAE
jgi:RNA polymerase sigma-70 factor, ECF subfamily